MQLRVSHPVGYLFSLLLFGFTGTTVWSQPAPSNLKIVREPPSDKAAPVETNAAVENAVLKVFSTIRYPDPYKPWTKEAPSEITGSGVVIAGKRILTCAHVALYASQIQVQANQSGDKISAHVEAIAPGIDLAVLKVDDESFFDTHPPLQFSKVLPAIKDSVMAYGYPAGGTSLSITKGIVSRIDFSAYSQTVHGLRIQIDAAINPGNSGGPAVVDDKMIGLAFSRLGEAENIGYIIPCEEIELFLDDVADGRYDGKPAMFDELQTLENDTLRHFLKLDKSVQGIVVHEPADKSPTYPLKEWDVITRIGDTPVDDQGMIKLGSNLRVAFQYLVQKVAKNGKVPLTIVREKQEKQVELPVSSHYPLLVPELNGAYPSYFVFGPMVFSAATAEFVGNLRSTRNARWAAWLMARGSPLLKRVGEKTSFDGEQLVVVASPFLPHRLTKGYSDPNFQVVKTLNGVPVKNLNHLVQLLRDSVNEYLVFEFDSRYGETLVLPRAQTAAVTDELLTDNGIRSQGTADTLAVWNNRTASK
jgi:S1-C subfamily serine protease